MKIIEKKIYNSDRELSGAIIKIEDCQSENEAIEGLKKFKNLDGLYRNFRSIGAVSGKEKPLDFSDEVDQGVIITDINEYSFLIIKPNSLGEVIHEI